MTLPISSLTAPLLSLPTAAARSAEKLVPPQLDFAKILSGAEAADSSAQPQLREFASQRGVLDAAAPLNRAGLPGTVREGTFDVRVRHSPMIANAAAEIKNYQVRVRSPDEPGGTSLRDVVAEINRIPDLKARITTDGRLVIEAQKTSLAFGLERDTSGLLDALGQGKSPLREAFDGFVGQTVYGQMLSSMRKTVGKPAYLHGGKGEEIFQSQLDQTLAEHLAKAQGGQFAEAMYAQQFNATRR